MFQPNAFWNKTVGNGDHNMGPGEYDKMETTYVKLQFIEGSSSDKYSVYNLATDDSIGEINLAGPADVDAAVFAIREAYESDPWSKFNGAEINKAEVSAIGQPAAILGSVIISIVAAYWRYYGSIEAKAYLM